MTAGLLSRPVYGQGPYLRLALLIGQSLWLGITLALVIVIGNSLFLADFGSRLLPYVYLTVAAAGILTTAALTAAQRRWNLLQQAVATLAALALFYLVCWLGLNLLRMRWISFALLVSFFLVIRLGFVFLGGQAGRLLDVRQIKRLFPLIVAGFVLGFLVGALALPGVLGLAGSPEQAVLALVFSTLIWLAFLVATGRIFGAELSQAGGSVRGRPAPSPSLRQLLRKRFVLLLFSYLMLAGIVGQLTDFSVAALVGQHFATSAAIAQFYSSYTAVLNVVDLLFVTLIAGFFLSRFGLGAGLLANPLGVGALFIGLAIVGRVFGAGSTLFFGLAAFSNVLHLSLTDGATRGATNAAYQALPAEERVAVQSGVEGLGGPLALGLAGVVVLVFTAIPGLTIVHLAYFTLLLLVAWTVVGRLVQRDYAETLLSAMRRRVLSETDLSLDDDASLGVVTRLLDRSRISDVRLALDMLAACDHPSLDAQLVRLAGQAQGLALVEVLAYVERRRPGGAVARVQQLALIDGDPAVQGAALRALCALLEAEAIEPIAPYLSDAQPERRLGALVGLLRYGGVAGVLAAGESLVGLARSAEPGDRTLAARAIGEVAAPGFYAPLLPLLMDPNDEVRRAALLAAGTVRHPRLLPLVLENLAKPATRSAAAATLVASGEISLPLVANALEQPTAAGLQTTARLVRIAGEIGGEAPTALLKRHLAHPNPMVRERVLLALRRCGYRATGKAIGPVEGAMRAEVEQSQWLLAALRDIGEEGLTTLLHNALLAELDQSRRRLFLLLTCLYDAPALVRAEAQLGAQDERARALALEMLDVTLSAAHKAWVMPLLDPSLSPAERLKQLGPVAGASSVGRDERLRQLVSARDTVSSGAWTRACALYTAARVHAKFLGGALLAGQDDPDPLIRETAMWALASGGISTN